MGYSAVGVFSSPLVAVEVLVVESVLVPVLVPVSVLVSVEVAVSDFLSSFFFFPPLHAPVTTKHRDSKTRAAIFDLVFISISPYSAFIEARSPDREGVSRR